MAKQDSRGQMVQSAAELISEHGMSRTSLSQVIDRSGSPRGSIYYHFPQGKAQIAEEALLWAGEFGLERLRELSGDTPQDVMRQFVAGWRQVAQQLGARRGCVLAGVALDLAVPDGLPEDRRLAEVVDDQFVAWKDELAHRLTDAGLARAEASDVAWTAIALMEGAVLLCRVHGDLAPMEAAARSTLALVRAEPCGGPR